MNAIAAATDEVVGRQLQRVFQTHPSYKEHCHKYKSFDVWCSLIKGVHVCDLDEVVTEICEGVRLGTERYEKPERLPYNILDECNRRAARRHEKKQQEEKYHSSTGAMDYVRNDRIGHMAIDLGVEVRQGKITPEQCKARVTALLNWEQGLQPRPDWLDA